MEQVVGTCGGSTVRTNRFRISMEQPVPKTKEGDDDVDLILMERKEVEV